MSDDHPSVDETFELIREPRRRLVLQYFKQHANPVALDDLAARIARWEGDDAVEPADAETDRVRESLHSIHLPAMATAGLLGYDAESREIRYDGATIAATVENARNVLGFLWRSDETVEE